MTTRRETMKRLMVLGLLSPAMAACKDGGKEMGLFAKKEVVLDVVLFSYLDRSIFDVLFNGSDIGVAGPYGGGRGVMTGVTVPLGVQTLTWRLGGPEGMARNGETVTVANALSLTTDQISDDDRYLGVHINLSIFGFSRGAALARAFSNDFLKSCTTDKAGQLTYQGFPIRIHFMGLFDTVASFGGPATNMDSFFTEKNLKVPGAVERCVHYVAAHEVRFSFPVDLIRQNGELMPNWTETVYPGVHSDVGGAPAPELLPIAQCRVSTSNSSFLLHI